MKFYQRTIGLTMLMLLAIMGILQAQSIAFQAANARATGYAIVAARNPGVQFSIYMIPWDGVHTLEYNANNQINGMWHAQAAVKGNYFDQTFDGSDFTTYSSVVLSQEEFDLYKSSGTQWWIVCSNLPMFSNGPISQSTGNVGIGTANPGEKLDIQGGGINIGTNGDDRYVNLFGSWRTRGVGSNGLWDEKMVNENLAFHYYTGSDWLTYRLLLTPSGIASQGNINIAGGGDNFIAGSVRIGTPNNYAEKLSVNGKIRAHEIKVETSNWPDYVFNEDYKKTSLADLEKYIKINKHLPNVPTAKEVAANGLELGEMNKILLEKIEELTLHLIQKDKENKSFQKRLIALERKINKP